MELGLLAEAVDKRIEKSDEFVLRMCRCWHRGILPEEELRNRLLAEASEAMTEILKQFGLRIKIEGANQDLFLEDYARWKNGAAPGEGGGRPWLLCSRRTDSIAGGTGDGRMAEAPAGAKRQFFRMAEAYRVPVEYFLPAPGDIPKPHARSMHTYADADEYLIWFECPGGRNFFDDPDPAGKEYVLADPNGLKASFRVGHVYTEGEKVPCRNYFLEKKAGTMAADGTIEGYMTERRRPLEIEKSGNRAVWVSLMLDHRDLNRFFSFPLWKRYFLWCNGKNRLLEDARYGYFREVYAREYGQPGE